MKKPELKKIFDPISEEYAARRKGKKNVLAYMFRVFIEAGFDEFLELLAVVASQLGRVVFGYQEEDAHRMQIGIGRLSFGQFDGRYPQRPYISLRGTSKESTKSTH